MERIVQLNLICFFKIDYKSQVWEVISRFSGIEISELPVQDGMINRHENVLMLTQSEHKHFGELKCWFVPVEVCL